MQRAAEAATLRYGGRIRGNALAVVELPAHRDHAASHVCARLLTHKTRVRAYNARVLGCQQTPLAPAEAVTSNTPYQNAA